MSASSLEHFAASVSRSPSAPCLIYFDTVLDYATVDELSGALAVALSERGVGAGSRVALMTQNVPQFILAELAVWKLGAIWVPLNPMFKSAEVEYHLTDSGATAMVVLESLYRDVVSDVVAGTDVKAVITTSELDFLAEPLPPLLAGVRRDPPEGTEDLLALTRRYAGRTPPPHHPAPGDVAVLSYTSGTTGRPKGAMNTHRNLAFIAELWRSWARVDDRDVVAALAPLFHIIGPTAITGVAFAAGAPIVLTYRFDPATILGALERHRGTFTLASITAFRALMACPDIGTRDLTAFTKVFSGGAPVPPATVEQWQELAGGYIHNCYGLTETTSPTHMVPFGGRAPVDEGTGALSIGVPVPDTDVRVVDPDTRQDVPVGEVGEFWIRGEGVVPGYWQRPEATAEAIVDGGYLRTGDVGKRDADGWFYLLDRSKDMIIASGFKVWPREVEDVLYQHPAVHEAAVVGLPDEYRGETVKAFVSLRAGASAEPAELVEFCRERLAAYKCPRTIEILPEIPKTATGKVLRRELRA
ncbi:AMP-binding protein [Jiangella mangrovi]|uniref:Long-chain acyl-CoA synthetase n=1 Tax=Jiangella mangrovi TaxID=1524084 RepID=A0A7W9GX36_9ACTN|nr:long-chain acyl-CoA synthetase [Jiangella mangrovi]